MAAAIEAFVPDSEILVVDTPLSKRISEAYNAAKAFQKTRGNVTASIADGKTTVARIWCRFAGPFFEKMKAHAMTSGVDDSAALQTAKAWLFRAFAGSAELEQKLLQRSWKEIQEASRALNRHQTRQFLQITSPKFLREQRKVGGSIRTSSLGAAVALFAMYEAISEGEKKGTPHMLSVMSSGMTAIGSLGEIAESMRQAPSFLATAPRRMGASIGKMSSYLHDVPIIRAAFPVAAWLSFVGAVLSVNSDPTISQSSKEIKNDAAVLAALALVVSVAQLATQATVPGLVLLVGQILITTRDKWIPAFFSDIETLPAVGRFLRSAWAATEKDTDLDRIKAKSPFLEEIDSKMDELNTLLVDTQIVEDGSFWSLAQSNPIRQALAVALVREQYGLGAEAAAGALEA